MKFDEYGCLVMEKDGMPGDLGDSCAETCRYVILKGSAIYPVTVTFSNFSTPLGFVRHPDAPNDWRENDFASDQCLPLLMATDLFDGVDFSIFSDRIKHTWATAPGKVASPGVMCVTCQWLHLFGFLLFIQFLIFKIPWRWSDDKRIKSWWKLVSSDGESADWLNYYTSFVYLASKGITWPQAFLDKTKAMTKVRSYYANQPDSDWVVTNYEAASLAPYASHASDHRT